MNRRPDAERNGKAETNGNGKGPHHPPVNRRRPFLRPVRQRSSLLPLLFFCLTIGLAAILTSQNLKPTTIGPISSHTEAFRWAVNRAMSAAELTQTAASQAEWSRVVSWWKESIDLMKTVPMSSPNYQVAQAKVLEYEQNLKYAQSKAKAKKVAPSNLEGVWTLNSRRAEVIELQGNPTQTDRYDSICKEVLHYGKSLVELSNGMVARYSDFDRNLKAAPENAASALSSTASSWTLGSTKEEVFKIQGTPSRITDYDYSNGEVLYYGSSMIELANGKVIGYDNLGNNLRVHIVPVALSNSNSSNDFWTLQSARDDIFRIQGTPTQVVLDGSACSEVFHYGESTVELKNGFLSSYNNAAGNLKVKVK